MSKRRQPSPNAKRTLGKSGQQKIRVFLPCHEAKNSSSLYRIYNLFYLVDNSIITRY